MEAVRNQPTDPGRILIDHVEEHTVKEVLDGGFWGDALPRHQMHRQTGGRHSGNVRYRAALDELGLRLGPLQPLSVPTAALELRARGHHPEAIDHVIFKNPMTFLRRAPAFEQRAEAIDVGHPQ